MILGKRNIRLVIVLAAVAAAFAAGAAWYLLGSCGSNCHGGSADEPPPEIIEEVVDDEPDTTPKIERTNGYSIGLSQIAPGKRVAIVVIKAPWCGVCGTQLQSLSARIDEIEAAGAEVVGLTHAGPAQAAALQHELGLVIPILSDADRDQLAEWGLQGHGCKATPGVVFLDAKGQVERIERGRYPGKSQDRMILEHLRR